MATTEEDTTDLLYKEKKSTKKQVLVRTVCIISSEFCERLAFYSVSANLVLFFINSLGYEKATANVLALGWSGTCYFIPLFGGWLADSYWGRFKTIAIFVIVYVIGLAGLAVGAIEEYSDKYPQIAITSLFVIALGMGTLKPNVVTFGADQFADLEGPEKEVEATKQIFFNWFYFSISAGAAISFTGLAYVQQNISFTVGLAIPAGVMLLSAVLFVCGYKWYRITPPSGSFIGRGIRLIFSLLTAPKSVRNESPDFWSRAKLYPIGYGGYPAYTEEEVDSMKKFTKMIPIFATYVLFGTSYAQMQSVFFTQGTVMNLDIGSFVLPVATLNLFNAMGILILVPIFDRILYPALKAYGIEFGMLRRIGAGFALASIGMIYAGGLEVYRLHLFNQGHWFWQKVGSLEVVAVDLSIFWQAPAYLLIAAGEVLSSVTGLEFAYSQSPPNMKSLAVAFFYLSALALGNYLGSLILTIVNAITQPNPWIGEDLNHSHMDLYFFLLAGLGFMNMFTYIFIAMNYELIETPITEESQDAEINI